MTLGRSMTFDPLKILEIMTEKIIDDASKPSALARLSTPRRSEDE